MPDDPIIGRYIPLSKLRGYPLPPDLPDIAPGPAVDYTGQGIPQEEYERNRWLARIEPAELEAQAPRQEMMDREMQVSREEQILQQLQELMAEQKLASEASYGREQPRVDLSQMAAGYPAMPTTLSRAQYQPYEGNEQLAQRMVSDAELEAAAPRQRAGSNWDSLSFANAFRLARAQGLKVFNWRGRPYAVTLR